MRALPERTRDWSWRALGPLPTRVIRFLEERGCETIRELESLPDGPIRGASFGARSQAALREALMRLLLGGFQAGLDPGPDAIAAVARSLPEVARELAPSVLTGLTARVRQALLRSRVQTLSELARFSDEEIRWWRNFGTKSYDLLLDALLRLKKELDDAEPDVRSCAAAFHRSRLLRRPLLEGLHEFLETRDERDRFIAAQRTLATSAPWSYGRIGRALDLSVERIRQLEMRLVRDLDPSGRLAGLLDDSLDRHRSTAAEPLSLCSLERIDPWFQGAAASPGRLGALLDRLRCRHAVAFDSGQSIVALRLCRQTVRRGSARL